ncbi:MAG TPA: sigma-70 family RNA polymerase sigma factor [Polyangia bacterium]|nr:sigma-70 family RNA polymerase sigma factor [Polyangia bacterium]
MDGSDWLAKRFDQSRPHLRAVAFRMLGSTGEADDAVQEAWLKASRSDTAGVENLGGWLTTVVARVCLDMLRTRRAHREQPLGPAADEVPAGSTPEAEVAFADAIGPALLVVLEMLAPQERVAFVLHDMFDLSFEEIAPIVERTPAAARQLASRARRRVHGAAAPAADVAVDRQLVSAFLAASRDGDFERLLAVLSPDAVLRADATSVRVAAAYQDRGGPILTPEVRGAAQVANAFKGRATAALPALIEGQPGAVWAVRGQVRSAFVFTLAGGKIAGIDLVMDEEHLAALDIEITAGGPT